jgi:hypothetical protein
LLLLTSNVNGVNDLERALLVASSKKRCSKRHVNNLEEEIVSIPDTSLKPGFAGMGLSAFQGLRDEKSGEGKTLFIGCLS